MEMIYVITELENEQTMRNNYRAEQNKEHNRKISEHFSNFEQGFHDPLDEFYLMRSSETTDEISPIVEGSLMGGLGVGLIAVTIAIGVWFYSVIRTAQRWVDHELKHGSVGQGVFFWVTVVSHDIQAHRVWRRRRRRSL